MQITVFAQFFHLRQSVSIAARSLRHTYIPYITMLN